MNTILLFTGVPLLFIHRNTILLEKPSTASCHESDKVSKFTGKLLPWYCLENKVVTVLRSGQSSSNLVWFDLVRVQVEVMCEVLVVSVLYFILQPLSRSQIVETRVRE